MCIPRNLKAGTLSTQSPLMYSGSGSALGLSSLVFKEFWAHLRWTEEKLKTVLWSDKSEFEIVFGNHGRHLHWAKEEMDHPACYLLTVQRPASVMVWGYEGVLVHMVWVSWTFVKAPFILNDIYRFWSNKCCQADDVFIRTLLIAARQSQTTLCVYYNSMAL